MATKPQYVLKIDGVDVAVKDVTALKEQLAQLNSDFGNAKSGTKHFQELQSKIASVSSQIEIAEKAGKSLDKNTKFDRLKSTMAGLRSGIGGVAEEFVGASNATGFLEAGMEKLGIQNVYLSKAMGLLGQTSEKSFGKAASASTKFGTALKAVFLTGPLLAFSAAVAVVTAFLTKTQEGTDKLGRGLAFFTGILTGVTNAMVGMGKQVVEFIEKALKDPAIILDAIVENLSSRVKGLGKIVESLFKLDFKGAVDGVAQVATGIENATDKAAQFAKTLNASGNAAVQVKTLEQQFEKLKISIDNSNASLERQMKGYEKIYNDNLKSTKEREAAFNKANALEDRLFANRELLAKRELELIQKRNSLSDTSRAEKAEEIQAEIRLADIRAEIKQDETEDLKFITSLRREDTKLRIAETKSELEETIRANQEKLASDEYTYTEKRKLIQENVEAQEKLIQKTLEEIDANDKSTATNLKKVGLQKQLNKLKDESAKQTEALNKEESKRDQSALDRMAKASIDRRKLTAEEITDATKKSAELKSIRDEEQQNLFNKYQDDLGRKDLTAKEKLAIEQEYHLAVEKLNKDLADKQKTLDEKAKEDAKAKADAARQAKQEEIDGIIATYSALADTVNGIFEMINEASISAVEDRMSEVDTVMEEAKTRLQELDSERQDILSNINSLEEQLVNAKGAARERIIKQLEQERAKEKQIANERKREDDRIKKAEQDKLNLEREKEKAIAKQVIVTQSLAIVQSTLTGLEAISAGISASKNGKFGWDNIAILVAMTGAIIASMSQIKSASKASKGYVDGGYVGEGGYTGDGGKYEEAEYPVHRGEYVFTKEMTKLNWPLIKNVFEPQRKKLNSGYFNGGIVAATMSEAASSTVDLTPLAGRLDDLNELLNANLGKPVFVDVQEVTTKQSNVARIRDKAFK